MVARARALWLVPCIVLAGVVTHVTSQEALIEGVAASPEAQMRIGHIVRTEEPRMRRAALIAFPGSAWSQGDDFAASERKLARHLAAMEGVRVGAVLDAIDRDVKAMPGNGERGAVAACMPRPFYD